ncbi:hypothetical protein EF847_00135 [Actinobacteria bacterium YIM 96077]|uniref:Uncharacterized protein n=1 Tax=Phytoactinopolyspora halophila TaxID=1981511 RepID=A0A329QVE0_9ACTN|nr:hypothetical protein EF847_00135 [Actinobacteria bacterium YIM 96077]RAW14688.1 hypothetical protein DPM12_10535 [Phytoactinopolyspora halophila]
MCGGTVGSDGFSTQLLATSKMPMDQRQPYRGHVHRNVIVWHVERVRDRGPLRPVRLGQRPIVQTSMWVLVARDVPVITVPTSDTTEGV